MLPLLLKVATGEPPFYGEKELKMWGLTIMDMEVFT
jgi:hypothetical protein